MADTFQVTGQTQVAAIGVTGAVEQMMQIDFITLPSNVPAFIRVPLSGYNPANVRQLIDARVVDIEAVHNL